MRRSNLLVVVICGALWAAPAWAQTPTVLAPASRTNVIAGDDWATKTFQDPMDMSQRTDVSWFLTSNDQPASGLGSVSFAQCTGGSPTSRCLKATSTTGNPNIYLLETGNPGSSHLGRTGDNYSIDANKRQLVAFRMHLNGTQGVPRSPGPSQCGATPSILCSTGNFIWNSGSLYDGSPTVTSNSFFNYGGWQIYFMDLSVLGISGAGSWANTVRTFRIDPTFVNGDPLEIDWMRIVPNQAGTTTTGIISWSGSSNVDIYLDDDNDPTNGNLGLMVQTISTNHTQISTGQTGNSYAFPVGALPPGDYYAYICATGSTTQCAYSPGFFHVNGIPTLTFTSPSREGSGDDFATLQLNNAWDMTSLSDVDVPHNIDNLAVGTLVATSEDGSSLGAINVLTGTSLASGITGDPYLYLLWFAGDGRGRFKQIDSNRYHILTVEMGLPNMARDINAGSIVRIIWQVQGEAPNENVSADIILNSMVGENMVAKIIADMKTLPNETDPGASPSTSGWHGNIESFRLDPHEFTPPTPFFVKQVKLAANEQTIGNQYTIRWNYADPFNPGAATLILKYDTDTNSANGFAGTIASGIDPTTGTFTWNTGGVPFGTYYIYASFSDGTNSSESYSQWPIVVGATLTDPAALPRLVLSRRRVNFGGSNHGAKLTSPETVRLSIPGTGGSSVHWNATPSDPSVIVSPSSGTGDTTLTISIASSTIYPDNLQGDYSIRIDEGTVGATSNSPQYIRVFFQMYAAGGTTGPFGVFDTPTDGSTGLAGSFAVTGWALDDLEVDRVEIWRDRVDNGDAPGYCCDTSHPGFGKIFIAKGTFIEGSRPDVEAAYSNMPFHYKSGWGYLLLSWGLYDQGNHTYKLYAFAFDKDGNHATLGTKTITVDNAHAVKPFGALDVPGYGDTVSGSFYNFGWTLTPQPNASDARTCTIINGKVLMTIDSAPPFFVTNYGDPRPDIATSFPGFSNGAGAGGAYLLDTTAYSNGTHNIGWFVTDNCSRADGLGSRFFNIQNAGGAAPAPDPVVQTQSQITRLADAYTAFPLLGRLATAVPANAPEPVRIARGFGSPNERATADRSGVHTVRLEQFERLEVHLPVTSTAAPATAVTGYDAYQVIDGELHLLPLGSSFDARAGIFYWQPAPAYLGKYDFLFVERHGHAASRAIAVRVVVGSATPSSLLR